MAKKSGKPNDDFPDIEKTQIVYKIKYFRFALCVNKQAIAPIKPLAINNSQTNIMSK